MHCGERQTRVDAAPVEQHGASAALAMITTFLGSCQREMFTQSIEKGCPRIERQSMEQAVDLEFDAYWSSTLIGVISILVSAASADSATCGRPLSRKAAVTVPDSRTVRRVIRKSRCPFSSMAGAFVPRGDPSSLVKTANRRRVPGF
jgi:hypothetical protein